MVNREVAKSLIIQDISHLSVVGEGGGGVWREVGIEVCPTSGSRELCESMVQLTLL